MAAEVTQLLIRWREGDRQAFDQLVPLVYDELRQLANRYMRQEHGHRTLQGTAVVHEAYLRLVDCNSVDWKGRAHFFAIAAKIIRNVLVDQARLRGREKRGGDQCFLQLDESLVRPAERDLDIVALDDALLGLEMLDSQQAKIIELRFFAGLTIEETAEALGISDSTVKRDWLVAKSWLYKEIHLRGSSAS